MVKACFLDRDGVINKLIIRENSKQVAPWTLEDFEYLPGVVEAVKEIKQLGFSVHITTNQPDVDDGLMELKQLNDINKKIKEDLNPDTIQCARKRGGYDYKPNNGMMSSIIDEFKVSTSRSFMIGDSWRDIAAGAASGLITIFIGEEYECPDEAYAHIKPHYMCSSLYDAVEIIESIDKMKRIS